MRGSLKSGILKSFLLSLKLYNNSANLPSFILCVTGTTQNSPSLVGLSSNALINSSNTSSI